MEGRRGLARPPVSNPGPLWSLGYSYPWPILHLPLVPPHSLTHTCTHLPPPSLSPSPLLLSPSSRQKHGIVSHVSASSCATGAMWGARSAKQWVGGGGGSIVKGWSVCVWAPRLCLFLLPFSSRASAWRKPSAYCQSSKAARASVTLCTLSFTHPPLPSYTHTGWNHAERATADHLWLFHFPWHLWDTVSTRLLHSFAAIVLILFTLDMLLYRVVVWLLALWHCHVKCFSFHTQKRILAVFVSASKEWKKDFE